MKTSKGTPPNAHVTGLGAHRPTEQEIAVRAYELFLVRGAANGRDLDDWLQAERELTEATGETFLVSVAGAS